MKNIVNTLQQAYAPVIARHPVNVDLLARALHGWYLQYPEHSYLHPCIIDNRPALVCTAGLSQLSQSAGRRLTEIALQYRLLLKEDQRRSTRQIGANRRVNAGVVLGFCFGLVAAPALSREHSNLEAITPAVSRMVGGEPHLSAQVGIRNGRKIISLRHVGPPSAERVMNAYKQKNLKKVDVNVVYKIRRYLGELYQPQYSDPFYIKADLNNMAHYYARFPQVVDLLAELSKVNVKLSYKKGHWQAQALGTSHSVDQVTVYFDSRVAARFFRHDDCVGNPACHVTPADALLHELLHAKLMIVDSENFIRQGGMKPTLYLFDHEKEVIAQENDLYRMMTRTDGLSRPIRRRHSGDLLQVPCALCLPKT